MKPLVNEYVKERIYVEGYGCIRSRISEMEICICRTLIFEHSDCVNTLTLT